MALTHRDRFQAAREAVPLPSLWRQYGHDVKVHQQRCEVSYTPCCGHSSRRDAGSLFIRDSDRQWNYHCFRCGKSGSAVDFVAISDGITPLQAANRLIKMGGGIEEITGRPAPVRRAKADPLAVRKAHAKLHAFLLAERMTSGVVDYLHKERHLSKRVIQEAYDRGLLRGLPTNPGNADTALRLGVGDETLIDAGLLKPGNKRCGVAYRPCVFLPPGGGYEFKSIRGGEPKAIQYGRVTRPLIWTPAGKVERVIVVEGGVDLMSMVDLGFGHGAMILGVLGASAFNTAWVSAIKERYGPIPWDLALDNDAAGDMAAELAKEACDELYIQSDRMRPFGDANDWNKVLEAAVVSNESCTAAA